MAMITYLKQSENAPDEVGTGDKVRCRKSSHLMQQVNGDIQISSRVDISYEDSQRNLQRYKADPTISVSYVTVKLGCGRWRPYM